MSRPPTAERAPGKPAERRATRIADVPPDRLRELVEGRAEAETLAEWLAVDVPRLLEHVLPDVGLAAAAPRIAGAVRELGRVGTKRTLEAVGALLHAELDGSPERERIAANLVRHRSNFAREWLAFAIASDPRLGLEERLAALRRLAADRNSNVREAAWLALRPHIAAEVERAIEFLVPWVHDPDPNVRRFAVEGTRPRGVWSAHLPQLKARPDLGLPLLDPVRSDPSRYVARAVSNWLNDASRSRPEWVRELCARWRIESPTPETAWICRRALRSVDRPPSSRRPAPARSPG